MESIVDRFSENLLNLSTEDFFNDYHNTGDKLRILQINMRSIRNIEKFDILKRFIDKSDNLFDIIIVCESWLNDVHFEFYGIDGFQAFFSGGNGQQRGGGVAIYVRESLNCDVLDCFSDTFNGIWITFNLQNGKVVKLAAYYRKSWADMRVFV